MYNKINSKNYSKKPVEIYTIFTYSVQSSLVKMYSTVGKGQQIAISVKVIRGRISSIY